MTRLFTWFNAPPPCQKQESSRATVPSAGAHLDIVSIHSFEEGNGRIRRLLSEKALSYGIKRAMLLSLSRTNEALQAGQQPKEPPSSVTLLVNLGEKPKYTPL